MFQFLRKMFGGQSAQNASEPSTDRVPCLKCGTPILKRMAALNHGLCTACSRTSVFSPQNYPPSTLVAAEHPEPVRQTSVSPELAAVLGLMNHTIWRGTWSEDDIKNLRKIIETIERCASPSQPSSYLDLLFVKGCAEIELGLTPQAIASFSRILEVKPDHFGAQVLRDTPDAKLSMLRRPLWGHANSTLPLDLPSRRKRGDVLLPVRDGFRLVVSAFLGVERDMFPGIVDPKTRSGVQVHVHDTPFGKVPTVYFFFDTHPTEPFVWEQCLHHSVTFRDKDPFTLATGIIRQMMSQDYLYVVPFDMENGQIVTNRKHPIDATLRKHLSAVAVEMSGSISLQTDAQFSQAMNWISANFDLKQLQWASDGQHSNSIDKHEVATQTVEKKVSVENVDSLTHILMLPERVGGPRKFQRYGTRENPNLMMTVSWELIETEPSRKRRIEAARELGKIGGTAAGKALAECYSHSGGDVKTAVAESLSIVLKAILQQNPDSHLLPLEAYDRLDKAAVLFQNGDLQFALSAVGEKALPFIVARLSKGNVEEKTACLSALGKIGTDDAAHILLQNVSSAEHLIRTAAINALANCGSPLAAEPLQEMLRHERDKKARRRLLRAMLATVRQGSETPAQLQIMADALVDPDLEARKVITEFLLKNEGTAQKLRMHIGDGALVRDRLRSWLNDQDTTSHYTAIRGLAILGKTADIIALESARRYTGDSATEIKKAISMIRTREPSS